MPDQIMYPTVVVPGIGQSRTDLTDENGNKILRAWPLDVDTKALVRKLLPSALFMFLTRTDCGFGKALYNSIGTALNPLKCNRHGRPVNRLRVMSFEKSLAECDDEEKHFIGRMIPYKYFTDKIGEENLFYFAFNPFGCAQDTVDALRDYILFVKKKTGAEKVNLISISLGGTLTVQYLDEYVKHCDIHRVVGIVSAFNGSGLISALFDNSLPLEKFPELLVELIGKKDGEKIVSLLSRLPRKLAVRYKNILFEALRDHLLLYNTTMWGAVPSGDYERLRERYLSESELRYIREYSDKAFSVRNDFKALVKKCSDYGTNIFSLCGYSLPLAADATRDNSDGIVHTDSCAMGYVSSPVNEPFDSSYENENKNCVLSPDRQIDASQSPIADRVWYFKNMGHEQCAKEEQLLSLAASLLSDDSVSDVHSSDKFPQFYICK